MRVVMFVHSIRSDWNNGSVHFLRGIAREFQARGHQVAIYEVGALLGDPNEPLSSPKGTWVLMSLKVTLNHVADLSAPRQQKLISTNSQELTGVWAHLASDGTPGQPARP